MFQLRRNVYCDGNATTVVSRRARKAMEKVLRTCHANPSSPYKLAHQAAAVLADARAAVARAVHVPPESLLFTSSATESNNTLRAIAPLLPPEKRTIIYNPMEHPSMLESLRELAAGHGFALVPLVPDRFGRIAPSVLESAWSDGTGLVVCMLANNETGAIYDVKRMAGFARERGALFFCDSVQALGKIPVDLTGLGVDYASFSAHKIGGPKGIGALYVRPGAPFAPFMLGGHQENGGRAGTESLHDIAGFAAAAEDIGALLAGADNLRARREAFVAALRTMEPGCVVNSPGGEDCVPGTVSLTFPGRSNALLMGQLDYYGVSVAAGSACNTGEDAPSHVLTAMGLSAGEARSTLRISFPHGFSARDLRYAVSAFRTVLSGGTDGAGRTARVTAIMPGQMTPEVFLAPDVFIIDLRRKSKPEYMLRPLTGSREFPVFSIGRRLDAIPRDKHLLLTCETGYDSPVVAYYLRRKGYTSISFLVAGLLGWRLAHPDLYKQFTQPAGSAGPGGTVSGGAGDPTGADDA